VNEASFTGQTQQQFSVRPPWMAEVLKTQEQFSVRPPWMAEVLKTQEQFSVKAGLNIKEKNHVE
jgi:hypothetical protein